MCCYLKIINDRMCAKRGLLLPTQSWLFSNNAPKCFILLTQQQFPCRYNLFSFIVLFNVVQHPQDKLVPLITIAANTVICSPKIFSSLKVIRQNICLPTQICTLWIIFFSWLNNTFLNLSVIKLILCICFHDGKLQHK